MRRRDGHVRLGCAAFVVLCLVGTLHASDRAPHGSWSRFVSVTDAPFRPGTAGRPFAWSTAVGDLNGDGTLDYAVADRIGRDLSGYEYSVDLSISGLAAQRVTFNSSDGALSITLRDVDHDQDLDVVVSTVISPRVVRVWLNDGAGAFAEARGVDGVTWRAAASSIVPDSDAGIPPGIESGTRRARDALALTGGRTTTVIVSGVWLASGDSPLSSRRARTRRSRAPPSVPAVSL